MTDSAPLQSVHPKLEELIAVLERLRAPGGCAWDREQTHGSLVQYLLEESYELVDAIEGRAIVAGDDQELIEELGDVLYQVLFHADIATEEGRFTLEDVAAHMTAKMISRHPHVFGDVVADTADAVIANWEVLKTVEKPHRTSVLDGIPDRMPSLLLAPKLVGRAERVGLAPAATEIPATEAELGEELLAMVVAARTAGFDPERALRNALRTLKQDIVAAETAAQ